jgi:hypothetical protein
MICPQAIERLLNVQFGGQQLVDLFEQLAKMLEAQPAEQVAWTLGYVKEDELKPGDLVPIINVVLTRHNPPIVEEDEGVDEVAPSL